MVDFENLYHKMLLASNKALEIIQQAQFECEKMYVEMSKNGSFSYDNDIIDCNVNDDFEDLFDYE